MKLPDHAVVNAQTGFLLKKVSAASFGTFAEIVSKYDLHPMHFGLMMMIEAEEPIAQHELGSRTGIDPSTMVARMDGLEERGLVERARCADDRRSYDITLSVTGRRLLAKLRKEADAHAERFFAPLSKAERGRLHELLTKLAANLE